MRVLIVGAYGLVGGYVTARLSGEGHEVIAVGRDVSAAKRRFPLAQWARVDLGRTSAAEWRQLLDGVSAVVNCAGALQDSPRDNLQAVHVDGLATLVAACSAAGVRRFVQISAAGVERGQGRFGQTKTQADEALRASDLEWVILRPGLVLAPAAYGGSALLRGLAAFGRDPGPACRRACRRSPLMTWRKPSRVRCKFLPRARHRRSRGG